MGEIISFPKVIKYRYRRAETLPKFRVSDSREKVTSLTRRSVSREFGLIWTAPLIIEFEDPISVGKRDIHLKRIRYQDKIWKMKWMDRTVTPGFKRYGLELA